MKTTQVSLLSLLWVISVTRARDTGELERSDRSDTSPLTGCAGVRETA